MRKIIRYASLSWDSTKWQKLVTWGDPDLHRYRGAPIDHEGIKYEGVIEDHHVMFALRASETSGAEMTVTPMEKESDVFTLKMQGGSYVYLGNGFIYYEDSLEQKDR